ncbi:hypothetical protein CYMTET_56257 [Cymbomonas tetramitiformis]|uniref:Uncharacterized protein n=1 Tax=Cymbomonas tetramitiformis TaxID=36881 RepID=A0AAE0EMR3_9CHLO|nr:hypothetical protein CYMTET_56257 [Cymbomonas tetramitiformis]
MSENDSEEEYQDEELIEQEAVKKPLTPQWRIANTPKHKESIRKHLVKANSRYAALIEAQELEEARWQQACNSPVIEDCIQDMWEHLPGHKPEGLLLQDYLEVYAIFCQCLFPESFEEETTLNNALVDFMSVMKAVTDAPNAESNRAGSRLGTPQGASTGLRGMLSNGMTEDAWCAKHLGIRGVSTPVSKHTTGRPRQMPQNSYLLYLQVEKEWPSRRFRLEHFRVLFMNELLRLARYTAQHLTVSAIVEYFYMVLEKVRCSRTFLPCCWAA